jgi:hypothetical protein
LGNHAKIGLLALLGSLAACAQSQPPATPVNDAGASIDLSVPDDLPGPDLSAPDLAGCGDCDDKVACTIDKCMPGTTTCLHEIDHTQCADGELCTATGCVKAGTTKVCTACSGDGDCSADEVCGAVPFGDGGVPSGDGGAGSLCLPVCTSGGGCPKGFTCDTSAPKPRCLPNSGACCLDIDGDQYGIGVGCQGPDCNDSDPESHPGHAEVCDGKDNDCNGATDDGYLCGAPGCAALGTTGSYAGTPIGECKAGACTTPGAVSCGKYTCMAVSTPVAGSACRFACLGNDDTACIDDSYCDATGCVPRMPDGTPCGRDRMCVSGHCQNGFCCGSGDCCSTASTCPASYATAPVCDAPATACQGHRYDKTCTASVCGSQYATDDSACGVTTSINCGNYPSQACNATADQAPLACPTTCATDRDCVASAYCNGTTCMPRVSDGGGCGGSNECLIGRSCLNGHCCSATTGACCAVPSDCPASYAAPASCDVMLQQCQGHRVDKTCVASVCGSQNTPDDSACGSSITLACVGFLDQACTGAQNQNPLACPTTCVNDAGCVSTSWCMGAPSGTCVARQPPGGACTGSNQCQAGLNCLNGFCCNAASGACCSVAANCPASYAGPAVCDTPSTSCQGHRVDKVCVSSVCGSANTPDDTACGASITISCGFYPGQACNGGLNQSPLSCPTSCAGDTNCAATAYCSGGVCVARHPDGGGCTAGNQCLAGSSCLNAHCCSASTGACCGVAADCPASYGAAAVCDTPLTSCQGHRVDKTCTNFICGSQTQADDSSCGSSISLSCGTYNPVACSGSATQSALSCPTSCTADTQCVMPANHCYGGQCVAWREQGQTCSVSAQCRTGFCVSGICCNTACNATTCDACSTGTCNPFTDPAEDGNQCLSALPEIGNRDTFDQTVQAYIQSSTDTSDWWQFYAVDHANSCAGVIDVYLDSPSGTDYDIYLYYAGTAGACSGTQIGSSILGAGLQDHINFAESCTVDDSGWYFVEVRRYASFSCTAPYTLRVAAAL